MICGTIARMSLTDTPNPIIDQLPKGLLDNIVSHLNPQKVILFGSRVNGESGPDSDWDLMIVVDDSTTQKDVNWRIMGNIRRGIRGAVDLIPVRESTFRDRSEIIGSLPSIAAREGVVVYDRTKAS